jgi:putative copper resistance protein D
MTHSHFPGNVKEEFLAELGHIHIAILTLVAGWSRWIEVRLPNQREKFAGWIRPVWFVLIGTVLMLYRESKRPEWDMLWEMVDKALLCDEQRLF